MKVLDIRPKSVYVELELSIEEVAELHSVLESTRAIHSSTEYVGTIMSDLRKILETVDGTGRHGPRSQS